MIVQFVLRETISGQESELNSLQDEIALIAEALGLEKKQTEKLGLEVNTLAINLAWLCGCNDWSFARFNVCFNNFYDCAICTS